MLERFPNSAVLYNIAGASNAGLMQLGPAINNYKQALQIKPDYAEVYRNIGDVLKDSNDLRGAIDSYKQALKIKPDFAEAYNNMGVALQDMGDLNAAIDSYKKVLKIKPDYAKAYYNMGNTLNDKGDLEAAIESYKHAIKIKPDYAGAFNNMGNALKDKGDLGAALKSHKQALKIQPDFPEAHRNMGLALYGGGDFSGAIEAYKRALKIEPNNTEIWNGLQFPLQAMKLKIPDAQELLSTLNLQADSKHFQITKSILSFKLNLGGENAERSLNRVSNLLSTADNNIIKNREVMNSDSHQKTIEPDKIVALVHFGRSGTGLLHSLIDHHPQVSTMPSIYFSEFFNDSKWEIIVGGGWNEMADRFIATYEVLFDASARNPVETKSSQRITNLG